MKKRNERGLALILVMTVVLALAIIATPFVLSMILQERTGTSARYLSQADYGADGAKNYAIWRLMPSVDPLERRSPSGLSSSYTYDTEREFEVRLDEMPLSNKLHVADPKGSIWGINVQDEQGKLNTKTCSIAALTNLSTMVDSRVVNLKDYLTLYSGRDATWICPQRLRQVGFDKGTPSGGPTVDNLHFLGLHCRYRASKPGLKPQEGTIEGNSILGGVTNAGFSAKPPVTAYVDGVIEIEQRHPVNINTAKRETLIAMWEGLSIYGQPDSTVDRRAAQQLATRFHGRETPRLEQFLQQLGSTSLNPNQKFAVALNAVCPNAALLQGTGSVGICFKSYDVYTLEATASMNNPSGSQVAGRGYREVVSVSPPLTLRRYCESQYDFNMMTSQLQTAMQGVKPGMAFTGFPYGSHLLTYPRPYTQQCDTALKPQGPGNEAYVTVLPAEDHRGELLETGFANQLKGDWEDKQRDRSHFKDEMDGKKTSGPLPYDWNQFFAFNFILEDDPPAANQRPDTGSGGFEIWAKWTTSPTSATIFDIKEQETTNRVTLRVENNELILTAADSTIPNTDVGGQIANGVAEIRWPNFKISDDTWTHFSAFWKSNRYADLAMLVDGFSDANAKFMHYTTPGGNTELMTKLSSALTPTSNSISLKNSSILPTGNELTPIIVGDEVLLVDSKGNAPVRGARGTVASDHPSQATASLFGYSSKLRKGQVRVNWSNEQYSQTFDYDGIHVTNASLTYNFGISPTASVCGDKMIAPGVWQIDVTATQVGVITPDITQYPDQGFLRIDNEVVFYTGRSPGGVPGTFPPSMAKFTGLTRAMLGTVAAPHMSQANCILFSVAVNDLSGFPQKTIIQTGDEWFVVQKEPMGKPFFVGFVNVDKPVEFVRGYNCLFSIPSNHSAADPVLPTFLARDVNNIPSATLASAGAGDRVTLVDQSNTKATAQIRRTSTDPRPQGIPGWQNGSIGILNGMQDATQVVALYQPVKRDWTADDLYSRMLKFPSGELLSRSWLETVNPKVSVGAAGQIDELKAYAGSKGRVRLLQQVGVGDNQLLVNHIGIEPFKFGGLIKFGDEFIGYGSWNNGQQGQITQAKRGWLNSSAELHDKGDVAFYLPWVPVSALSGDVTTDEKVLHLQQHLQGDPEKYRTGYVLLDNEMLLFTWNGDNGLTLSMPPTFNGQKGLYRGMFGTQPATHSSTSSLVYGMPFRMWDTYKAKEFDNTMVYFQWGQQLDLAHWNSFLWRQELPTSEKLIKVHGMARLDGNREFWDAPAAGELVDSITAGPNIKLDRIGHRGDAGQFDFRFYVEYPQGSFDAANPRGAESWKRCPKIKEVQVEYDRPTQTLHHEDN